MLPIKTVHHTSQKLQAPQIVPWVEQCPVCLSEKKRRPIVKVQDNPRIDYLFCPSCYGYSASHMPTSETLRRLYNDFFIHSDQKYTFEKEIRFARHILRHFDTHFLKNDIVRILDLGGGDGGLAAGIANILNQQGKIGRAHIDVVDYYPGTNVQNQTINLQYFHTLQETQHSYDLVLASAVLEHIPFLHPVLKDLGPKVKSGAMMYIRTPSILPLKRVFRSCLDLFYPYHVHDLGAPFWNRIIHTFGLNARIVASQPAIVETWFRQNFVFSLCSYAFKAPAWLEILCTNNKGRTPIWKFVGGWEIFLQFA